MPLKPWPTQPAARKFSNRFGVSLSGYWSPLLGFDVVKFDEQIIKAPDGVSTHDNIKGVYGPEAAQLVEGLVHAQA